MTDQAKQRKEACNVFDRVEKKYLISKKQMAAILKKAGDNFEENKFSNSTVMTIYFDTPNDDLIIKSIESPIFKEKVRVRCYGTSADSVFLEIKTKTKFKNQKCGFKRRIKISLKDLRQWLKSKKQLNKFVAGSDMQIADEIEYLFRQFSLEPKIFIAYERRSFEGAEDDALRVTFDENLRYRTEALKLSGDASGKKYFCDDKNIILEIKTSAAMPLWLVHILSEEKIYPQKFSKYGKIYQQMKGDKNV